MLKIEFKNAVVEDRGYGVEVEGKSLNEIISTALGTRAGSMVAGYTKGGHLKHFLSNCCDVTVIINPTPASTLIESGESVWESVEAMEEAKHGQFEPKDAEKTAEE